MVLVALPARSRSARARPAGRLVAGVVAVAAAVAMASLAGVGPAAAEPVSLLHATPNPVVVAPGATSGTYSLSWSTGSTTPAELTYAIGGGPESGRIRQAPSGHVDGLVIELGQRITWRLYTPGKQTALRSHEITSRPADRSCARACIKEWEAIPHGTSVEVGVDLVSRIAGLDLEVLDLDGNVVAAVRARGVRTYRAWLGPLEPSTSYRVRATAWDEAGYREVREQGTETLDRKATITVDEITVLDDSDDLSPGDLRFFFKTDGSWDLTGRFDVEASTGETVDPNYSIEVPRPSLDVVGFGVQGTDDDCDVFDGACTRRLEPDGTSGSDGQADWASGGLVLDLRPAPFESFTAPWRIEVIRHELEFVVEGTVIVSYS